MTEKRLKSLYARRVDRFSRSDLAIASSFRGGELPRIPAWLLTAGIVACFSASVLAGRVVSTKFRNGAEAGPLAAFQMQDPPRTLSITLNGATHLTQECGNAFEDPGASATNSEGKVVPVSVSGTVDTASPGKYSLTYTATDKQTSISAERTVTVQDTTPPQILLEGGTSITVACGQAFVEPGASAIDNCQGPVPVTIAGSVDPNIPGTYTISYTAKDDHDNSRSVTRTVTVGETEAAPPTIKLSGKAEMTLECGEEYIDAGAQAGTACSGPVPVTVSGVVDISLPGSYFVIYKAFSGESYAERSRVVTVVDTKAPVISLNGDNPLKLDLHRAFADPGATARDGCAGTFTATAAGSVDSNTVGSYTITYTASDPSGNQAIPVTRTVNVVKAEDSDSMTISALAGSWALIRSLF